MAQKNINIGSSANKGDGDPLRTAFSKAEDNFTELYGRLVTVEAQTGIANPGGAVIQQSIIGSVIGEDSTTIIDHATSTIIANKITGDLTGSVVADDSTVLIDGVSGTINAGALTGSLPAIDGSALTNVAITYANITSKPTTLAGYGITDALQLGTSSTTALAGDTTFSFADITSKPTTVAGYGITDATSTASPAFTGAVDFTGATSVDFTGATISGTSFLTSVPAQSFASLTGKPTTLSGYGIQSNLHELDNVNANTASPSAGKILLYVNSNWESANWLDVLAYDPLPFSSVSSKPTTLAGYGITDAATLNNMAPTGAVDFTGATSIDFNTVTINNLEFADISATPTTLAGYGITDALQLGTSSTTALAGDTALFDGAYASLTSTPTTLAGYGITDALSSGGNITLGGDLDVGGNSIVSASNGAINIAPDGSGTIDLSGQVKFAEGMIEKFATTNGATGVTALDCSTGNVHYLTAPTGDITANFTNLGLTAEYATNLTVIINQGATPYEVTAVQIGGAAQTINWQGGSAPTGNANGIDSFSFTILNDGGTYVVLGQMVDFT